MHKHIENTSNPCKPKYINFAIKYFNNLSYRKYVVLIRFLFDFGLNFIIINHKYLLILSTL